MATAGIYNGVMDQGATWTLTIVYQNPDGTPINLTGYTGRMQLRSKFDSTAVLTLSTANGGMTITGPTGTIDLIATATQMELIDPGIYVYDLELTSGSTIQRLIQGQITVRAQVTANV
jgi:hypothetical protein